MANTEDFKTIAPSAQSAQETANEYSPANLHRY